MEPIKRTTYVKVEYWDCGNADHRHKSSVIADNCIKLCANTKPTPPPEINRARYILATREVLNGATHKQAVESIGVSPERARQTWGFPENRLERCRLYCVIDQPSLDLRDERVGCPSLYIDRHPGGVCVGVQRSPGIINPQVKPVLIT